MGMPVMTANDLPPTVDGLTPAVGTAPEIWTKMSTRISFVVAVILVVGLATLLITIWWASTTAPPRVAVDGLGIFAVFFVAALAVERLIEPLTLLDPKKPELEQTAKVTAAAAAAEGSLQAAANAKAIAELWATYRAIGLWGVASIIGALAAALLNLHLLNAAGIQTPSLYLEILATGLIIGAGTKPLHELNKLVTAKKS